MGIASKGPRIVLRELSRGCTVLGRETVVAYDRDLIQTYPLLDIPRTDRELVFRELSGIDSVVTGSDLNTNSILLAIHRDLFAKRDLLRNDMDEPHPDAVPDQRERVRPERTRESLSKTETLSQKIFRYPDGTRVSPRVVGVEPARLLFRTTSLPTFLPVLLLQRHWMKRRGEKWSRKFQRGASFALQGQRDREEIHPFSNEVAERERRQAESHSRALIRAERKGRRTIAVELARRVMLFDAEFRSFKDAQDYVGDFRECRGSVGTLWKSLNADFSFLSEVDEMSGLMDGCAQAESMVPPIEGRIRELWEPIEVSEDTTEVGADAADEGGEVDQPADSFGVSMSGYLDLDL
ncbi:hypothetical protein F2Q70_00004797 [Brassica cretica]|uniref:Uncharacterized protein n=1 Tax=Brassica cretica TaxID=69181 RepID=A0A8S9IM84_BRACR|nr:hypothetical protein F2Q70_00004797 [Brassica cretica]